MKVLYLLVNGGRDMLWHGRRQNQAQVRKDFLLRQQLAGSGNGKQSGKTSISGCDRHDALVGIAKKEAIDLKTIVGP